MTDLARTFNEQANQVGDRCTFARVLRKASGAAATLLSAGWPDPEANGPQPVIWSPAASGWGSIVNQRLADQGQAPIAPASKPFMLTPLVIAMPQPMAEALGYPDKPLGFKDITELANDPEGWAKFGHPEWGPFRLGKTNPNFSTSGLNFTVAEYYAATGKSEGLTSEDLARPDVEQFASDVEGAVVHYGDTTLTFLNNWYRADARGTALTYVSAVAVEEKSVLDYNRGDPDGVLDPGEVPRPPKVPLVAIYPTEGTLFSDNPLIILDAPWVSPEQQQAAELFRDYVLRPENQQRVLEFGFRPGNPQVAVGDAHRRGQRRRPGPAPGRARGARAGGPGGGARQVGRAAQGGAGAAGDGRVGLDGRAVGPGGRRPRSSSWPSRRRSPPSTSSRTRTRSACASSPPTSPVRPASTTSTCCRSSPSEASEPSCRSASSTSSRSTGPRSTTSRRPRPTSCATPTTRTRSTPWCC